MTRVDGAWRVRWRVTNGDGRPVRLLEVRAPHGRFRSEPVDLDTVVTGSAVVEHTVRVEAAPGEEIENAFLIFVLVQEDATWRVLFRIRARMAADGTPAVAVETSNAHRVGFSEV